MENEYTYTLYKIALDIFPSRHYNNYYTLLKAWYVTLALNPKLAVAWIKQMKLMFVKALSRIKSLKVLHVYCDRKFRIRFFVVLSHSLGSQKMTKCLTVC